MDVFSRLMMDRIIFLGTEIDDYTANTLQAQGLVERTVENKLAAKVKETVTLKTKEVTMEEFRKLAEKK